MEEKCKCHYFFTEASAAPCLSASHVAIKGFEVPFSGFPHFMSVAISLIDFCANGIITKVKRTKLQSCNPA